MSPDVTTTRCPQCGNSFPSTVKLCPNDGTVLEHQATTATQLGKVLDGKYRLDAFLSHGGMGAVYRATHVMLGKTIAVKLINPDLVTSPEIVRRFQREARAATALNHPNIVAVYDLGQTTDGTLYIAMEFVNGPSLKSVIETGGPISPTRTIGLLRQVAGALSVAHRHGIVHRDLKPHNIMLAKTDDGQELAKLVDFGIAKTFDEATQLTMTGYALGTPQYMAPEQAEGRPVDARSDLYSLGVILYEMLTGDVPFNDTSAPAILVKHIKEAPVAPSLKNPRVNIPADLEAVALRCLEKDPARRFQTADEFATGLERAAAAIPGAAAAMQATLPIAGTPAIPPPGAAVWSAPTVAASAASPAVSAPASGPAAAPTAAATAGRATQPMSPRSPSDTRSTAVQPAVAAAAPASSQRKSAFIVLAAMLAVVALAAVSLGMYLKQQREQSSTAAAADAPPATPAMATQAAQTAPPDAAPPPTPPAATESAARTASATADAPPSAVASSAPPSTVSPARAAAITSAPAAGVAASGTSAAEKLPPRAASVAVAAAGRTAAATTPATGAAKSNAPSRGDASSRQAAPPSFPESPAVFFHCAGAPEVCSALRAQVDEAIEKGGLSSVRTAARADVDVAARVEGLQEKVTQQFGTTFATRTYSIELTAETTHTSEAVSMPPSTTLNFDPQFGSERVVEKARVVAGDLVEKVKAFARRKAGR
jgi:eukaryotic-like serine/threonine-protein kinase